MGNKNIADALGYIMQGQKEKSSPTSNNHGVGQIITADQLYIIIDKQRQLIEELSLKVNGLETTLKNEIKLSQDVLLKRIEKLDSDIQSMRPENTHRAMLVFLQKLNKYIDNEKIDRDFAVNIREYISNVLDTYGYKIVDYSPESTYAYEEEIDLVKNSYASEEEIGSVESIELVHRAIIDSKGNVVLKGKVYINKQ